MGRFRPAAAARIIQDMTGKDPKELTEEEAAKFNEEVLFNEEKFIEFEKAVADEDARLEEALGTDDSIGGNCCNISTIELGQ